MELHHSISALLFVACMAGIQNYARAENSEDEEKEPFSTPPLNFETNIDIEHSWLETRFQEAGSARDTSGPEATLNLKPDYLFNQTTRISLDFEINSDNGGYTEVRKLYLEKDYPAWTLRFGKQTLPISNSEGEFINDNFYEFAELRTTALLATYESESGLGVGGYLFDSKVDTDDDSHELDTGALLTYTSEDELIFAGVGYLSDLSEAVEPLVELEPDTFLPRAPALSGQLYITTDTWRIMLEHIESADELTGAEADFDRPRASSLEAFIKSDQHWLLGARYQMSHELEEAPESEYGLTGRYWFDEGVSLGLEYVHGKFRPGQLDEEERELRNNNIVTVELTFEF